MILRPPRIGLPRTGQTAVDRVGDDGTYQAGVRAAGTRVAEFVDNLNGTVTDYATGLVWVKQPELIIPGSVGITTANQILRSRATWKVPPDDGLGAYVATPTDISTGGTFTNTTDSNEALADKTGGLTLQETRDAMKLAPTAGAPAAGSVDEKLNAVVPSTPTSLRVTGQDIKSK